MSESRENLLRVLFQHKLEMDYPAWEEVNEGRVSGLGDDARERVYEREEWATFPAFCDAHAENSVEDIQFLIGAADEELWGRASQLVAETGEVVPYRELRARGGDPRPPETYSQLLAGYNERQPALPPLAKEYDRLMRDARARPPPAKDKEIER